MHGVIRTIPSVSSVLVLSELSTRVFKAAKTVTYQDIELLGIEVFGTEAEARTAYQQRLKTFARVADRRAWVHFDAVVRQWLATECVSNPPTLDAFKDAFQNDPARREKEARVSTPVFAKPHAAET